LLRGNRPAKLHAGVFEIYLKEICVLVKNFFAWVLSILFLALSIPVSINAQSASIEKTRSKVQTLSLDRDKQIEVKLSDKTKIKGYITSVDADSFTLTDRKTSTSQTIFYGEVDDVKRASSGFSAKTWLILGGVAAGTVATWLIVKPAACDGGAQTRGIC
jgi:hypothetical protein